MDGCWWCVCAGDASVLLVHLCWRRHDWAQRAAAAVHQAGRMAGHHWAMALIGEGLRGWRGQPSCWQPSLLLGPCSGPGPRRLCPCKPLYLLLQECRNSPAPRADRTAARAQVLALAHAHPPTPTPNSQWGERVTWQDARIQQVIERGGDIAFDVRQCADHKGVVQGREELLQGLRIPTCTTPTRRRRSRMSCRPPQLGLAASQAGPTASRPCTPVQVGRWS